MNEAPKAMVKLDAWSMPYKTADSEVSANIEIWYAKLFQHGSLRSFLRTSIAAICADTHANFDRAGIEMDRALDDHLWNAVRSPDAMPHFKGSFMDGPSPTSSAAR